MELMAINLLMDVTTNTPHFPVAFTLVYIIGFIAAVGIGLVTFYNSKRPVGWENKKRPGFIPDINVEETPAQSDRASDTPEE